MSDVEVVKRTVNLLNLVGWTDRRPVAGTHGGEWAGPCPCAPDSRDRLRVWPNDGDGRWWCRRCDEGGDCIAYVQKRDGVDFREALRVLGGTPGQQRERSQPLVAPAREAADEQPPSTVWQTSGLAFVAACEESLWSTGGVKVLDYLHERGLADETIRAARLGFQPQERRYEPTEFWGLPRVTDEEGRPRQVWLPRGVVIPWIEKDCLWQLKVRTNARDPKDRYKAIRGGRPFLFGVDAMRAERAVLLTEGEFDCLLVAQECADLVDVLTLGSCSVPRDRPRALRILQGRRPLFVALDADRAGAESTQKLLSLLPHARGLHVPYGKDPTEFHQCGGRLRDWVSFALACLEWEERARDKAATATGDGATSVGEMVTVFA